MEIGLFGTCGSSIWREKFISIYKERDIEFFNPQLPDGVWTPDRASEFVQIENENLKTNNIVLFPVTSETTGQGSLAEIGFSVLDVIRNLNDRYLIVLIDDECLDGKASKAQKIESERSRILVKSKVIYQAQINERIFLVNNMDEMLDLSLELHSLIEIKRKINKQYNKYILPKLKAG